MKMSTVWISQDLKDELAITKIKDKKSTFEELLKAMFEAYKKEKESHSDG